MCDVDQVTAQSNISVSKFALLNSLEHEVSLLKDCILLLN